MTKFDFSRTAAAIVATMVMSATLVFGAVGPAASGTPAAAVAATRPLA